MSDPEEFDPALAALFSREHQHFCEQPFVASTMHRIRFQRRLATRIQTLLRIMVLLAAVIASPWLIAGATRLNAALAFAFSWIGGLPGAWMLGALAAIMVLMMRARSR
jgi:TRAP-type C4-dicarboxylate transport system permease small subunit